MQMYNIIHTLFIVQCCVCYLQGETDIDQLAIVLRTLGTPTTETWPGVTELPDYNKITFPETQGIGWDQILSDCMTEAIDLTKRFLVYNADKRLKAKQVWYMVR
jgi:cell cycle related kinase